MGFRGLSLGLRGMVQKPGKLPIAIPSGSLSYKNALNLGFIAFRVKQCLITKAPIPFPHCRGILERVFQKSVASSLKKTSQVSENDMITGIHVF